MNMSIGIPVCSSSTNEIIDPESSVGCLIGTPFTIPITVIPRNIPINNTKNADIKHAQYFENVYFLTHNLVTIDLMY